ncbi:HNH endonuclease [Micromonospora chersina]|uniref:HNH endonuclease n=1 Tax=Micromonospora chersina TaxID=47854 RepID=UPI00372010EC
MCGAEGDVLDHVKPLAKGGSGWPANLRPACNPCNLRKSARWPYPTGVATWEVLVPASCASSESPSELFRVDQKRQLSVTSSADKNHGKPYTVCLLL